MKCCVCGMFDAVTINYIGIMRTIVVYSEKSTVRRGAAGPVENKVVVACTRTLVGLPYFNSSSVIIEPNVPPVTVSWKSVGVCIEDSVTAVPPRYNDDIVVVW